MAIFAYFQLILWCNKGNRNGGKKPSEMCLRNIWMAPKETTKKRLKFAKSWWPCMKNFQNWTKWDHICIKPKYFASQLIIQVFIWHVLLFIRNFIYFSMLLVDGWLVSLSLIFLKEKNQKDSIEFQHWKMTLKIRIFHSSRAYV